MRGSLICEEAALKKWEQAELRGEKGKTSSLSPLEEKSLLLSWGRGGQTKYTKKVAPGGGGGGKTRKKKETSKRKGKGAAITSIGRKIWEVGRKNRSGKKSTKKFSSA